jgi:hypothetical protein
MLRSYYGLAFSGCSAHMGWPRRGEFRDPGCGGLVKVVAGCMHVCYPETHHTAMGLELRAEHPQTSTPTIDLAGSRAK